MERLTYVTENGTVLFSPDGKDPVTIIDISEMGDTEYLEQIADTLANREVAAMFYERKYNEKCKELAALQGRWIPVEERLPEDSKYILLSFSNVSLPMVGRYEKDEEGGAFYLGDCDEEDTCVANDLSVNAWMPLPRPYRPYRPEAGAALAGPDRAGLTPGPVQESDILQGERCKGPAASGRKGIPVLP